MKKPTALVCGALVACLLGVSAAQAQNILILTTGARNSPTTSDLENNHMPFTVQEFSSPLTFGDFAAGGSACNTTRTTTDLGTGLTKSITCNQTELVNGTAMSPAIFDPGYDLLVVASAYTSIDSADWPVIEEAVRTRRVRGAVFFVDTINDANTLAVERVLSQATGSTIVRGDRAPGGNFYYPLNTNAAAASSFAGLPTLQLNTNYYTYNGVPSAYALYTGTSVSPGASPVAVTDSTSAATAIFVPQSGSYAGAGSCVFGVTDIGWGLSGTGHNVGKLGNAFLHEFNDPAGVCSARLASPPVIAISKTTPVDTAVFPANGTTVPYTVEVSNVSAGAVALNVGVSDPQPAGITLGAWTCTQVAPATPTGLCPGGLPTGALNTTIASLPAGAVLRFNTTGTVSDNSQSLTNIATVALPPGAMCAGDATPCDAKVLFGAPPSVSLTCSPNELFDRADQVATCTVTSSSPAPAGGLSIALSPPPSGHARFSTTCGTSILLAQGATQAQCTITASDNTALGDGDVPAVLALLAPGGGAPYVLGAPAQATVMIRNDDMAAVPTLSLWGLFLTSLGVGGLALRRQRRA